MSRFNVNAYWSPNANVDRSQESAPVASPENQQSGPHFSANSRTFTEFVPRSAAQQPDISNTDGAHGAQPITKSVSPSPLKWFKPAGPVGMTGSTPQRSGSRATLLGSLGIDSSSPIPPMNSVRSNFHQHGTEFPGKQQLFGQAHSSNMEEANWLKSGDIDQAAMTAAAFDVNPHNFNYQCGPIPGLTEVRTEPHQHANAEAAAQMHHTTLRSLFLPDEIAEQLSTEHASHLHALPKNHASYAAVPTPFVRVWPLDMHAASACPTDTTTGSFGYLTSVFKATNTKDGITYALRRVDGVRTTPAIIARVLNAWRTISNETASVVPLRDIFTSSAAVFFVHDFCPGALTLRQRMCDMQGPHAHEKRLWSIAVQLVLAIRETHKHQLTWRGLTAHRILCCSDGRVRISSSGVIDVLESDTKKPIQEFHRADVRGLGIALLEATCRSTAVQQDPSAALNWISSQHSKSAQSTHAVPEYSSAWLGFLQELIERSPQVESLLPRLSPYIADEMLSVHTRLDTMHSQLSREWTNGRLLRVLIKLGFITERPEHAGDPNWAEIGDRYLLKLFRDYIFHQVNEHGRPVLDLSHVLECLWRLDLGDPSRVLLSSRDQDSLLVASYASIRAAANAAYDELRQRREGPSLADLEAAAQSEKRIQRQRAVAMMSQYGFHAPTNNQMQYHSAVNYDNSADAPQQASQARTSLRPSVAEFRPR